MIFYDRNGTLHTVNTATSTVLPWGGAKWGITDIVQGAADEEPASSDSGGNPASSSPLQALNPLFSPLLFVHFFPILLCWWHMEIWPPPRLKPNIPRLDVREGIECPRGRGSQSFIWLGRSDCQQQFYPQLNIFLGGGDFMSHLATHLNKSSDFQSSSGTIQGFSFCNASQLCLSPKHPRPTRPTTRADGLFLVTTDQGLG